MEKIYFIDKGYLLKKLCYKKWKAWYESKPIVRFRVKKLGARFYHAPYVHQTYFFEGHKIFCAKTFVYQSFYRKNFWKSNFQSNTCTLKIGHSEKERIEYLRYVLE